MVPATVKTACIPCLMVWVTTVFAAFNNWRTSPEIWCTCDGLLSPNGHQRLAEKAAAGSCRNVTAQKRARPSTKVPESARRRRDCGREELRGCGMVVCLFNEHYTTFSQKCEVLLSALQKAPFVAFFCSFRPIGSTRCPLPCGPGAKMGGDRCIKLMRSECGFSTANDDSVCRFHYPVFTYGFVISRETI